MAQTSTKLWNKDFIMLTIGQVISLFANGILRFALPLHILFVSDSPELMGRVMAFSFIPALVVTPIGGALADRFNKKRIIVFLDFFTAAITFIYLWTIGFLSIVPITVIALMLFSAIKGMMSSATDASIPLLVPADELVRANSVTMTINTLSMLLAPMLGGVLLTGFGLEAILIVSGVCLALAAAMEIFIRIPCVTQESSGNMFMDVLRDVGDGLRFAVKEKPIIAKILLVLVTFQFILPGVGLIGVPVLITQNLGMDGRMVGISQGIVGAGGIAGGILVGVLGQKLRIQMGHWPICIIGILVIPMGLVFFIPTNAFFAYSVITAIMFIAMGAATVFTIQLMTFFQLITPVELLGKMMSLVMLAAIASQPLGNWLMGILLEQFADNSWIILFASAVLTIVVGLWARVYFKGIRQ